MPQGRGSTKSKSSGKKGDKAPAPTSVAPEAEAAEGQEAPFKGGCLVRLVELEEGENRIVEPIGETKLTELPTLLRLAAKDVERRLGIE